MNTIKEIFDNPPGQWALRGDPFLWMDLEGTLDTRTIDMSLDEFDELLRLTFNKILKEKGRQVSKETYIIDEYPKDGMSGGGISLTWWNEVGLPLLKDRYTNLKK
ncbi:MAG: hypothetical protein AB7O48_06930 [Cyclobacteriaceae bacterium]